MEVMDPDLPDVARAGKTGMPRAGKYARIERERRFLLADLPVMAAAVTPSRITDRYLTGTRLRLRRVEHQDGGGCVYKLTQKIPAGRPGPIQGLITNTYLSRAEHDLLATLPAAVLSKARYPAPPLGIDVFGPPLQGLILAEAEFSTDQAARSFQPPRGCIAEVTDDSRFTGGVLARTRRPDLLAWLGEYGIGPAPGPG
jgi:CYTH domain-containing protein